MAKISFDLEDGSPVQQFDVSLPVVQPAPLVPEVQGVSLEDIQKAEADAAQVEADLKAEEAKIEPELPVAEPVVEAPTDVTPA